MKDTAKDALQLGKEIQTFKSESLFIYFFLF